jgi:NADPH:quinone reductase-like Zn-dependent oxidoreductase
VIDAVGDGVARWGVGDRVTLYPGLGCGDCRACRAGEISMCPDYGVFGEQRWGGLAEYTIAPAANLHRLPDHLSDAEAAAVPAAYTTAFRMLKAGGCGLGTRTLIIGAGGGVATALVSLARAAGLRVWVTSRDEAKRARSLEIGAHEAFESGARLPDRVDAVMETVGRATWSHSVKALRPGGVIVISGATSGPNPDNAELTRVFFLQLRVVGSTMGTRDELASLVTMLDATGTRPLIDRTLPMDQAPEGFAAMAGGDVFGKIVFTR